MSLIKCPECGGQVSSKADICVHCGIKLDQDEITDYLTDDARIEENLKEYSIKSYPIGIFFLVITILVILIVSLTSL